MNKILAIVFSDEKAAYEGVRALSALDGEGSIECEFTGGDQERCRRDGLKGARGRGVPGLDPGRHCDRKPDRDSRWARRHGHRHGAGALAGLIGDLHASEVDEYFLSDVSAALIPGKFAVLADVDEEWVTPVDTPDGSPWRGGVSRAQECRRRGTPCARGGCPARRNRPAQSRGRQGAQDRKAKLKARIDQLQGRLEKKLEQERAQSKQAEEAVQAKVQALQKKADQEKGDAKAAIEARITRLRDDYKRRQHA